MKLRLRHGVWAIVAGMLTITLPASSHIVVEEPWHPVAAAYLTAIFAAGLDPVDWSLIRSAYDESASAAFTDRPASVYLADLENGSPMADIDDAIQAEERAAFFAASTRATSQYLRARLADAAANLGSPGEAQLLLSEAQSIYRAFGSFIDQADPEAGREIALAWLDAANALGSAGVLGRAELAADVPAFEAARATIDGYFDENYEPVTFTSRTQMAPLPETVIAAGAEIAIAPWLPPGSNLNDQDPLPLLVLNFEEQGIEETDLPVIAFGDMLFDSPQIFGDPARSLGIACATCHNRSDINQTFFIPGLSHQPGAADVDSAFFNALLNDRRSDSLDIPSLRGIRFTAPYGRDGRFAGLRDFVRNVIVNEFAGPEPTPFMLDALVAYMLEFDFLPNRMLIGDGRLSDSASEAALRGQSIFNQPFPQMNGMACASCHIPSSNFTDGRSHNIGSGAATYANSRDAAFDTPTLLGIRYTAPYMHDGSITTLAGVVDWFNDRYALALATDERADLVAYLEAVGGADEPYQSFDESDTAFRLAWEELTTFASTLNTLIPRRDAEHALLLIETVAADLAADASGMANVEARPRVYALSNMLSSIGDAITEDNWEAASERWAMFVALQQEIDEEMY